MASQRVWAKILEFVFGRSIGTKSLEEVGIRSGPSLLEYTMLTDKSSRKFSQALISSALKVEVTFQKGQIELR